MADIPRGTSTDAVITLGETFRSRIDDFGDRDWIRIDLTKGDWVQVDLTGRGAEPLEDPFLRLYDRDGGFVVKNDDGGAGLNAQLTFRANYTGPYYIQAEGLDGDYTGQYQITAVAVDPPAADASIYWGTQVEDTTVTVYFAARGDSYDGYTSEGFRDYEIAQFQKAFDRLEAVSGLRFEITGDSDADFKLVLDTNEMRFEDDPSLAYFNPPGTRNEGVGVFNGAAWDRQADGDLEEGGEGFVTITHELLHGLGLAHPHDTGGTSGIMPGVTRAFDDYGEADLNQGIFTTMSYNSGYWTGTSGSSPRSTNYGFEAGPMALDIAALQSLYGTGSGYKTGNTTYTLPGANREGTKWQAIWDTGGEDTLRFNGNRDAVLDLRPASLVVETGGGGFVSAADGVGGGFTIAQGVVIENALGGNGADRLIGNSADNDLTGGAGADVLRGRGGDDRLFGGAGRDDLQGGNGADDLRGGAGDDTLAGDTGRDALQGGNGADLLIGGGGADDLRGQAGSDVLRGGGGADTLRGGNGADRFDFNAASDSAAGATHDVIIGFTSRTDQLDLAGIDADTTRGGNQAFEWIGKGGFSDAGQLRFVKSGTERLIQADRNGDGLADLEILLTGSDGLRGGDFIL